MTADIPAPAIVRLPLVSVASAPEQGVTPLRGVVRGNGLGGLAVARALYAQGTPAQVTVIDRSRAPAPDRHGLAIAPTGLNALASMGLLDRVVAAGQRLRAVEVIPEAPDDPPC